MKNIADWLQQNGIGSRIAAQAGDLVADSRLVTPGAVFVALPGVKADGRRFAADAVSRGAAVILSGIPLECEAPVIVIPNLQALLPRLAATFFDRPSNEMKMIGVTGTNGKTTTSFLVEHILTVAGMAPGLIGTVSYRYGGKSFDAPNTTPEPIALQRMFRTMRGAGCQSVVMEVSSHGIAEHRVDDTAFDVGVFTNLTQDHLDFHGDMENYFQAKTRFFTEVMPASSKTTTAVVNIDDSYGKRLAPLVQGACWSVGAAEADFAFGRPLLGPAGFEAAVKTPFGNIDLRCPLPGTHNVYNAVEALAASVAAGVKLNEAVDALATVTGVPGRLEHFTAHGVHVYVDYAHSDDALTNVISALRPFTDGRLITVFGCGGDRDRGKRPRMGKAAATGSDVVVLTSDNPRTEDPEGILREIEPGILSGGLTAFNGRRGYWVESDRRTAIAAAIREAKSGDVVLVAGKGHEDYQIIGTQKTPFDDRVEVRRALAALQVEP